MDADFLRALGEGLAHDLEVGHGSGNRLVEACVEATQVTGAGIMLMVDGEHRGTLSTSDAAIAVVEELQFTLGEGPCVDTCTTGRPVLEANLRHPEQVRWQGLSGPALDAGVEAIFGFPLTVGTLRIGALDLYSDRPRPLSPAQFANALDMADIVAHTILELQAHAAPGALAGELEAATGLRMVVHQAAGMLAVQLDISVADALSTIRAHAFSTAIPIDRVGRSIVNRELRLGDESGSGEGIDNQGKRPV